MKQLKFTFLPFALLLSLLTQAQPLSVSITQTSFNLCFNAYDAALSANAAGGTGMITYAWSNGDTTQSISGLNAGTYSVTVTDALGDTASESIVVTQPATMTISIVIDSNVSCAGYADGGATIIATGGDGPYTYDWSTGDSTQSVSNLSGGSYIAAAFDTNGCSINTTFTITEPFSVDADANVIQPISCNGDTNAVATVSGFGGTPPYSFVWSNGSNDTIISSLNSGTYFVTVYDSLSCFDTNSVQVINPDSLLASAVLDSVISCNGLQDAVAEVIVTGGTAPYSATWSNASNGLVINGLGIGTYDVLVTDANGCEDSSSVIVTEPSPILSSVTVINDLACFGDTNASIIVSTIGGWQAYTYSWSNGAFTDTNSNLSATTYFVTVTDSGGCESVDSIVITSPSEVTSSVSIAQSISCNGLNDGGISAIANGGTLPYSYLWNNGDTLDVISDLIAGVYSVTIQDSNGCERIDSILLDQPDSLISVLSSENVSCQGSNDGSAEVAASGGNAPYSYVWNNGSTSQQTNNLSEGIVSVSVTDDNGCENILQDSISYTYPLPELFIGADTSICEGETLTIAVSSAFDQILWSTNASAPSILVDQGGLYSVHVIDSNGCSNSDSIEVMTELCVGYDELQTSINGSVYPNPSNGNFNLVLDRPSNGAIKIYNASGAIVYANQLRNQQIIPISLNAKSGIYFISLQAESAHFTQSIIIR